MKSLVFRRVLSASTSPFVLSTQPPRLSPCREHVVRLSAVADGSSGAADDKCAMVKQLSADMKESMKAKDKVRLDAIRFLQAAVKSREIELRQEGKAVTDEDVIKVIQKMAKQRKDSIDSYRDGGREDLAEKEQVELDLLESYLPTMMSAAEVEAVVAAAVADTGATAMKDMKKVMGAVAAKTAGRADSKMVSEMVRAKLSGK